MGKSIKVTPKKRGRPATGRDPFLTVRVPQEAIDAIEVWAVANEISRSEAVRRLLVLGLAAPKRKGGGK
jgi:Ribbon-helix-helix protein, copG family